MEAPREEPHGNLPADEFATFPPFTDSREAQQYVPINYSDFSVLSDERHDNSPRTAERMKILRIVRINCPLPMISILFDYQSAIDARKRNIGSKINPEL